MSMKPNFLKNKESIKASNKKRKVFIVQFEDETTDEFVVNWTMKHQKSYERHMRVTGDSSLIRRSSDLRMKANELYKKISKLDIDSKDKEKAMADLTIEQQIELGTESIELMSEYSTLFFDVLHVYCMTEFSGEWTMEESEDLHSLIMSSYSTQDMFQELHELFDIITGGEK